MDRAHTRHNGPQEDILLVYLRQSIELWCTGPCRIHHLVGVFSYSRLSLHILQNVDQSVLVLVSEICWNRPISTDIFQKALAFFMYSCLPSPLVPPLCLLLIQCDPYLVLVVSVRAITEEIYITVNNPTLNRNIGKYNLPHLWDRVLHSIPELKINK